MNKISVSELKARLIVHFVKVRISIGLQQIGNRFLYVFTILNPEYAIVTFELYIANTVQWRLPTQWFLMCFQFIRFHTRQIHVENIDNGLSGHKKSPFLTFTHAIARWKVISHNKSTPTPDGLFLFCSNDESVSFPPPGKDRSVPSSISQVSIGSDSSSLFSATVRYGYNALSRPHTGSF